MLTFSLANAPRLSEKFLTTAVSLHPDGIGLSYAFNGQLITKKGFKDFEEFNQYYLNIPKESPYILHFRKSSAGAKTIENLQPFFTGDIAWALNGTVQEHVFKESDKSDCFIMHDVVIKPLYLLDNEFHLKYIFKTLLKSHIGAAKMVIMNKLGLATIINETKGEWNAEKTIWFSNDSVRKKLEEGEKKEKHKKNVSPVQYRAPIQYTLPGYNPNEKKKSKYYLCGDSSYKALSEIEIENLKTKHRLNTRKLKNKGVIAKFSCLSDAKKYEIFLKETENLLDSRADSPTVLMGVKNNDIWREKWSKLTNGQQKYLLANNLTAKLMELENVPDYYDPMLALPAPPTEDEKQLIKKLDEIGRTIDPED